MRNLTALKGKVNVCLPDGSVREVQYSGEVHITLDIILKDVLYITIFSV